jgi:hypothetical protein
MSGRSSAPGERPEITAPGGRPAQGASSGCARPGCGHPRALHSNGKSPCRAFACSAGPCGSCTGSTTKTDGEACGSCHGTGTGAPCPGFVDRAGAEPERALLAS